MQRRIVDVIGVAVQAGDDAVAQRTLLAQCQLGAIAQVRQLYLGWRGRQAKTTARHSAARAVEGAGRVLGVEGVPRGSQRASKSWAKRPEKSVFLMMPGFRHGFTFWSFAMTVTTLSPQLEAAVAAPSPLTHFDAQGQAHMVDVGAKASTQRTAVAQGRITLQPATLQLVASGSAKKGDVLGVARIAAIMAAKKTSDLIPRAIPWR